MKIGIFGRGKMGLAVGALVEREKDMELSWYVDVGQEPGAKVDVALDASATGAVAGHLAWAESTGTDFVIATTGWDRAVLDGYGDAGIGILHAPNFSLAVAFLRRAALALGRFAALDPDADLAVVERHHRAKADAPSGTAKLLAEALGRGSGRHSGWVLGAASPGKVSVASLRSGDEVGYHELRLEAAAETLVLSHEAKSRDIFARGALSALRWVRGRKGIFTFDDVAADVIDPLFR